MSLAPLCAQSIRGVMCTSRIRFGGMVIASATFGYSTTRTHADANVAQCSAPAGTKTSMSRSAVVAGAGAPSVVAAHVADAEAVDAVVAALAHDVH